MTLDPHAILMGSTQAAEGAGAAGGAAGPAAQGQAGAAAEALVRAALRVFDDEGKGA